MEFTYNGLARHSYGFFNPNHAAAMIVMLLPFFWALRAFLKNKWSKLIALLPETALYIALIFTYSRSGIIALVAVSLLFLFLYKKYCLHENAKFCIRKASLLAGLFAVVFFAASCASGALPRFYRWVYTPDKSVSNRFPLWKGALDIFADNPMGVGTGFSGRIYTEFYQAPDAMHSYRTMVNSFLTFTTEQGLIWSSLLATVGIFALWNSFKIIRDDKSSMRLKLLALVLTASLFGGIVCGMGSTCFDISCARDLLSGSDLSANAFMQSGLLLLFLLLILAMLCLIRGKFMRNAVLSCIAGTLLCLFVLATGCFNDDVRCKVLHAKDGATWIKLMGEGNGGLLLLPDKNTCERKALLKFFRERYPKDNIIMPLHSNSSTINLNVDFDTIVLCGSNINVKQGPLKDTILYLPDAMPSKGALPEKIKKIYLSAYDEKGNNASWEDSYESAKIIEYLE